MDMNILETANAFKNALNQSRLNMIEALNDNQKQLYDLFFKVIGVPNIIVISAISNTYLRNILHSEFYLKCFYLLIIYSYLVSLMLYVGSFFFGNYGFKKKIRKIDKYSSRLQGIIDNYDQLEDVFQDKMNSVICSTHHVHRLVPFIQKTLSITYVVNILSFIIFIIILVNNSI
jgi:hypothetical protein